jgi:hypothetical protein
MDDVKVDGKNVKDDMYRILVGEHDHLVDLVRDGMKTVGVNRCLFDASSSRHRRLAGCIKRSNISMDLANIIFSKGL